MKTKIPFQAMALLLSGMFVLAAVPAARADAFDEFEEEDDAGEWWQKEWFGVAEGYYTQLLEFKGAGFAFGADYVNNAVHFGLGFRGRFATYFEHDYGPCKGEDSTMGLDVFVPVRITDAVTVYAGGGFDYHDLRFNYDGGGVVRTGDGDQTTECAFAGLRWRYQNMFVFGEYRRSLGEVKVHYDTTQATREYLTYDMEDDTFRVGAGFML